MAITVRTDIVSAEAQIFSGLTEMVIVSGEEGELGILPGHAPLLTSIKPGQVRVILQGGVEEVYYISGGMLEVQPDKITVLADTVIRAADLDEAQALESQERAQKLLTDKKSNTDYSTALAQLARATAQLRVIQTAKIKQHSSMKEIRN